MSRRAGIMVRLEAVPFSEICELAQAERRSRANMAERLLLLGLREHDDRARALKAKKSQIDLLNRQAD